MFSNGILILAGMAGVLIVAFRAEVTRLIPLYAVGVFTGFTPEPGRHGAPPPPRCGSRAGSAAWSSTPSAASPPAIVLIVVVVSKFTDGRLDPGGGDPGHRGGLPGASTSTTTGSTGPSPCPTGYKARRRTHTVVVLVGRVTKGSLEAIAYARSLRPDRLVAVSRGRRRPSSRRPSPRQWEEHDIPVELRTLYSPYRELSRPIMRFVDEYDDEVTDDFLTVVLPEFVLDHWYEQILHNQSALVLRTRLRTRPNTVVTSVPFHLKGGGEVEVVGQ